MTIWSYWEEISRIMAVLCLITAGAAIVAAGILVLREELGGRLRSTLKSEAGKRKGILLLAAAGVWILVIGKSVSAAEAPAAEVPVADDGANAASSSEAAELTEQAGAAGTNETVEKAPEEEPGSKEDPPVPDEKVPIVSIQMTEETKEDEDGLIYCRQDNAGIRVRFTDDREGDTGIISYQIVIEDSQGRQIRREYSTDAAAEAGGESEAPSGEAEEEETMEAHAGEASLGITIGTEEITELADGMIHVSAVAADAAGNEGEAQLGFVLDTKPPVITEIRSFSCEGEQETEIPAKTIYDGTDLYYSDKRQITRVKIEDVGPVSWSMEYCFQAGEGESSPATRQITGQGAEAAASISAEGTYSGWLISGEDLAGNPLLLSPECKCTQDAEGAAVTDRGIAWARRKILDRTAPVGEICYRSDAKGFRYRESSSTQTAAEGSGETQSATEESGAERDKIDYYFGGNIEVSLRVSDKCADAEMTVDPGQFKLMRKENGAALACGEGTFLVKEDRAVQFGAFGRDRAGNALVVREVFLSAVEDGMTGADVPGAAPAGETGAGEPDSSGAGIGEKTDGTARTEQADEQSCSFGSRIVRDTVSPVAQASINKPIGNPAGIDAEKDIVYFGKDSAQYGDGVPAITITLRVIDANLEPGRIEMRTAFSEVPGGSCCEEVTPGPGEAVREECEVRRGSAEEGGKGSGENSGESSGASEEGESAEEGNPEEVLMTLRKFPGREGTPDGVYRLGFAGTDKAGNPLVLAGGGDSDGSGGGTESGNAEKEMSEFVCVNAQEGAFISGRKVVDTAAPKGEISIVNEDGEVYCRMSSHGRRWAFEGDGFMPFRREREAVIEYTASDTSPVSASCRLLSTAGERNEAPPSPNNFRGNCEGKIRIHGGQVFRIENWVLRDRAGNVSAPLKRTVDFYLDTQLPEVDIDAPVAVVRAVAPVSSRTADGKGLYNGAVDLEILAADPDREHGASGLQEVYCAVKINGKIVKEEVLFRGEEVPAGPIGEENPAEPAEGKSTGLIDEGDSAADPVESGPAEWTDRGNYAPVYRFRTEIRLPAGGEWESNDIEVTAIATDNAGNRSDPGNGGSLMLGIDSTAPVVHVTYDNNEVRNGHYFDRARKATIEVRERGFDPGKLVVTAPGAQQGEWKRRGGTDRWVKEVRFAADGEYTLEVSGTDAVGNAASVTYAGEAPQEFVIDRIPPRIEVIWDNEDVRNGMYYNRPRCATVRITDLSPDERAVQIFPYARALRRVAQEWDGRTAGPVYVYEAQVPFTEEGEWSLHCACMDLAGNTAVPVYEDPFVIDMTAPRLCFDRDSVREMGAYGSGISPVLLCEDQNIAPGSLYAAWRNLTAGGALMECRGETSGDDGSVILPNLPEDRAADGICVLYGTACDLAGNRSRVRRNLSVNRFGSVYDLSEDAGTMEIVNGYYTDAQSPFVVAEYNVSSVKSRKITLYKNSGARALEEGTDYRVSQEKSAKGMKYICEIEPSTYCEEGKYSILIESEDEAGNLSRSPGRFRGGTGYSPTWAVDRTPPQVRLAGEDVDGRRFVADSLVVNLVPSDNMELKKLEILITDEKDAVVEKKVMGRQELDEIMGRNGGQVPVTIRAVEGWQTLRAVAIDGAGNRSSGLAGVGESNNRDSCRVLVSENLMVHLYRSGLLPAAAFLAFLSAIWFAYGVYKRTLA